MFDKILVPVSSDPKERSEKTFDVIRELNPKELVFLHILPQVPKIIGGEDRKKIASEEENDVSEVFVELNDFATALEIPYKDLVEHGAPDAVIVQVAEREEADLIIMVSSGRDNLSEMLIGSFTERVLRNTKTMLLVIK
ncbi:MAG: universal stress protein [Desulfovibrio sp.]|nr:universal stress protein [Desulfovibrio sp.]